MDFKNKFFQWILLSALMAVGASQQVVAQSSPKFGIKGGLNVSNLYIDDVTDENARIGTHIGLYTQLFASDVFAIQPELLFSTKGSKNQYDGFIDQEIKYNLSYIDLPVLAVIKLGESVELHAGGYASYLLAANISYDGDITNGIDEVDKDNLKSYDYGLAGGIGLNVGAVQIGARYNYGLVEIADSDDAKQLIGNAKNSCAQLFVAFNFGAN